MADKTFTIVGVPATYTTYGQNEADPMFAKTRRCFQFLLRQLCQEGAARFLCSPHTPGWDFWGMEVAAMVAGMPAKSKWKPPTCGLYLPYQNFQHGLEHDLRRRYEVAVCSPKVQPLYCGQQGQAPLSLYKAMIDESEGVVCIQGMKKHPEVTPALEYALEKGKETFTVSPRGGRIVHYTPPRNR